MLRFRNWALVGLLLACATSLVAAEKWRNPLALPPLPEAISSFGAATSGDYIYVFGGHAGRIAGNSVDALSPHFVRLMINDPEAKWEALPMQASSQSPGLLGWKGAIYRVGGLSFDNKAEEDTLYHSLANFARFDPETKTWTELPSLPAPRSSLDAAIVDDKLYVVGGWNLQEKNVQDAPWHEDALVFDLTKSDATWQPIAKPPFVKRALAVAAHNHKLYAMGGMSSTNSTTRDVHVYDPQSDSWSEGPTLPGADGMAGFAISAFANGGKLYFSGSEGVMYVLDDANQKWEVVERLTYPRSFHRLIPFGDDKLVAIAGVARGGGYLANVEVLEASGQTQALPKVATWSVPFHGKAKHSQILFVHQSTLYAFGGNGSRAPHDFSKEAILAESYRFDLAARTVETLAPLPKATQSGGAFLGGSRIDQSIYIMGGISHDSEKFQSTDAVQPYRLRSKAWSEDQLKLPASRAMFSVAPQGDKAWIVGGSQVNTGEKGLSNDTWAWKVASDEPAETVAAAALATPRRSFGGVVFKDKYYVVGGLGADSKIVETAAAFDLEKQTWSDIASPHVSRVFPSLAVSSGKLYLYGGFARVDGHFQAAKTLEVFDPETNRWEVAQPELPFTQSSSAMVSYQDRLLFFGVDNSEEGVAQFALYDPNPKTVGFGADSSGGRFEESGGSAEMVTRLLRMDKNKDGQLTADEVGERFRPAIAKMDENTDGVVTKEEIEAYVKSQNPSPMRGAGSPMRGGGSPTRGGGRPQ